MIDRSVRVRSSAFAAGIGMALAALAAGCGGSVEKTEATVPTASSSATPAAAKPAPASYAEISRSFTRREKDEQKALRRDRHAAIAAYVAAHGTAADAEKARKEMIDLAEALEDWGSVVKDADGFVAAHPAAKAKGDVLNTRAQALAALGREDEAKAAYQDLTKSVMVETDGLAVVWSAWSGYAGFLADCGDIAGAKAVYASCKEAAGAVKETKFQTQMRTMSDQGIALLASIGAEPKAFPDAAKDMDAKALSLKDFAGKVLLIDFWATWCPPCRAEIPNVVAAYEKWHEKGFEVVGISLDQKDKAAEVKEFLASYGMPWRQFYDGAGWQNEIAKIYEVRSIPHTILVGRDGKILRLGLRGPALERALSKLLSSDAAKKE